MPEQQVGNPFAPRHLLAGLETLSHMLQVEVHRVVRDVGYRHVGIQEFHRLLFLGIGNLFYSLSILVSNEFCLFVKGLVYVLRTSNIEY